MESSEYKLLSQQLTTITSMMNTRFDGIDSRLDKLNGKVEKHECRLNDLDIVEKTHVLNCPINGPITNRVRTLEDKMLSQESIKKYMNKIFIIGIALGGLIVGVIELIRNN